MVRKEPKSNCKNYILLFFFFFSLLNIYPLSIAVHIKFAPFTSCSEISRSPAEPGSWKLLPLCALHGRRLCRGTESCNTAASSHAGIQDMCGTLLGPRLALPCLYVGWVTGRMLSACGLPFQQAWVWAALERAASEVVGPQKTSTHVELAAEACPSGFQREVAFP